MFERVTLRASDLSASRRFYDIVLTALGTGRPADFALVQADAAHRITRGLHIGFVAESKEHVQAFWKAGVDAGFKSDGDPGPRPQYGGDYYGGFLLDPDGNSAEAVVHGNTAKAGIDHLWIRVADVAASKAFFEALAADTGITIEEDRSPELVRFRGADGTFSLVAGPPSENVCLALRSARPAQLRDPDGNLVDLV